MKAKFLAITAAFTLFSGTGLFPVPLESLLPEAQARQLLQSGAIDQQRFDTAVLNMIPRYQALERLIEANLNSIDPDISVESLRLYKKPSQEEKWTESERTELFNGIVSLSTLKGLEYFSKSRNRMRIFYESSTVIDGPESKNPRPDPAFRTPPPELSVYARQKDLTFGDNIYKYTYYSNESSFIILLENITAMNYGPVTVVGKNKLKSAVGIFDCGPYLLIYTASTAKASILPGMKNRVGESVNNRANALLLWFIQKADKAFGKTG